MTNRQLNPVAVLVFLICTILLLANFYGWAAEMIGAINYPFQLDYGEGIVWQQADMILRGEGYKPLSDNSFIIFHYPPLYHLVSGLLAKTFGLNWLVVGRTVSVLSTLGAAFIIGALVFQAVRSRESILTSLICAPMAGLLVFTLVPVAYWSPLARVDMISVLFTLAGVWFGLRSIEQPGNLFPAAVFFVLAFFAKQTAISAPLATFIVLLCWRPAMAWRGLLLGSGLGLICFAAITIGTSGEFIRHIITYNVNTSHIGQRSNDGLHSRIACDRFRSCILISFSFCERALLEGGRFECDIGPAKTPRERLAGDSQVIFCRVVLSHFLDLVFRHQEWIIRQFFSGMGAIMVAASWFSFA